MAKGLLELLNVVFEVAEEIEKHNYRTQIRRLNEELADGKLKNEIEWIDIKKMEWIDVNCKNNKKLYDVNGNIIVIGKPGPKIHTMATYDMNGNMIEDSPVKVKKVTKTIIFMDPDDKKDEKGKLKKLYQEGFSKKRYNALMRDLNK
jgi:hypothetical protein